MPGNAVPTYYGILRALFAGAVDLDVVGRSPCRGITLPALDTDEKRVIDPTELHRLADVVGRQWRTLIYLGGIMGLRFGEAIALRALRVLSRPVYVGLPEPGDTAPVVRFVSAQAWAPIANTQPRKEKQ